MALVTKKVRCTTCGNKNEPDQPRCSNCTRPIHTQPLASQILHDEVLWSPPVETRRTRKENGLGKWFALALLLIAVAASNYFYFGYGPGWANNVADHEKGYDWRTYEGASYQAELPGTSVSAAITMPPVQLSAAAIITPAALARASRSATFTGPAPNATALQTR